MADSLPGATGQSSKPVRKWEIFPGRNKFCCDGRVVLASQLGIFYFTLGLTVIPSILFFALDGVYFFREGNGFQAVPILAGIQCIFVVSTLLRTALTDPGILPRSLPAEAQALEARIEEDFQSQQPAGAPFRPAPRVKEVLYHGHTLKLKYCYTCKLFRPPRASHCSTCDNCVDRFDHHCPWVGNCVGRRNYKYFYLFLVSTSVYCIYVFCFSIYAIVRRTTTGGLDFADAMKAGPMSLVLALICFFALWSTLGLAGFHTYLTCNNMTTNEDIKGSFKRTRDSTGGNPFSKGSGMSNCSTVLCGPLPPSLIDARSFVSEVDIQDYHDKKKNGTSTSASGNYTSNYPTQPRPTVGYGTTNPAPTQGRGNTFQPSNNIPSVPLQQPESQSGLSDSPSDLAPMLKSTSDETTVEEDLSTAPYQPTGSQPSAYVQDPAPSYSSIAV